MIDRTAKPKIPSKFAKRDTNNLPVILYETISWLPTDGQGISLLRVSMGLTDSVKRPKIQSIAVKIETF